MGKDKISRVMCVMLAVMLMLSLPFFSGCSEIKESKSRKVVKSGQTRDSGPDGDDEGEKVSTVRFDLAAASVAAGIGEEDSSTLLDSFANMSENQGFTSIDGEAAQEIYDQMLNWQKKWPALEVKSATALYSETTDQDGKLEAVMAYAFAFADEKQAVALYTAMKEEFLSQAADDGRASVGADGYDYTIYYRENSTMAFSMCVYRSGNELFHVRLLDRSGDENEVVKTICEQIGVISPYQG
ncbi:MAG: hypothetical protein J5750_02025 [Clostridiales bacterium]|nr:hypothetical protein [Clostridiales bacterium]